MNAAKKFRSQWSKKKGVWTNKATGKKISDANYRSRLLEAENKDRLDKGFPVKDGKKNYKLGINPDDWWKSPWIIKNLLYTDVVDPENPNRYLTVAEYNKSTQKEREKAEKLAELQELYPYLKEENLEWDEDNRTWSIVNVKGSAKKSSSNATINEVDTSISSDEIVPPTTDTNRAALTAGNVLPNQTVLSQADIEAGRLPETKGLTITDQQKIKLDEQVQSTREALTPHDISIGRNVPEKEALSKAATTPPNFLKKWDHSQYWGEGFSQKNANQRDADILADLLTIDGKKPKVTNNELMIAAENMRIRGKDSLIFEGSKGRFLKIGRKSINLKGTGL